MKDRWYNVTIGASAIGLVACVIVLNWPRPKGNSTMPEPLKLTQPQSVGDFWDAPMYRVDVFRQDDQEMPIQRLGYYDRASFEAGLRQIAIHWMPHKGDTPVGVTVWSKHVQGWINPHDEAPIEEPSITWLEVQVKVGHGNY